MSCCEIAKISINLSENAVLKRLTFLQKFFLHLENGKIQNKKKDHLEKCSFTILLKQKLFIAVRKFASKVFFYLHIIAIHYPEDSSTGKTQNQWVPYNFVLKYEKIMK